MMIPLTRNLELARMLDQVADLLASDQASMSRANVWRESAAALRAHPRSVDEIFASEGLVGLTQIPSMGRELTPVIADVLRTGRAGVRMHLAASLASVDFHAELTSSHGQPSTSVEPSVALLLEIDRRYREVAATNGPRRRLVQSQTSPGRATWLPILHVDLTGWRFMALYSTAPLARQLKHAHDWVEIHFERGAVKGHATVLTAPQGPLVHRRVVRDREAASRRHYGLLVDPAPMRVGDERASAHRDETRPHGEQTETARCVRRGQ